MRGTDCQTRRFCNDYRFGANSGGQERARAEALVLFVGHGGNEDLVIGVG